MHALYDNHDIYLLTKRVKIMTFNYKLTTNESSIQLPLICYLVLVKGLNESLANKGEMAINYIANNYLKMIVVELSRNA